MERKSRAAAKQARKTGTIASPVDEQSKKLLPTIKEKYDRQIRLIE